MQADKIPTVDPLPSGTDEDSSIAPQLSTKLRDNINKLAKWRIDPSLIEFPESTSEFKGGHATVSKALLTLPFSTGNDLDGPKNVEGGPKSGDGAVKRKAVAVKKLKTEGGSSLERILELALREAGFLAGLSHPNVTKLEGFVEDLHEDRIWLIFPWEEHGNLKNIVASQDWEIPERIWLIDDVARGVEYLHSRNPPIYHGDLKSVMYINVLVTLKCRAVITDFGSARRLTKRDADPQMTQTENKAEAALEFQATFCATTSTMTFTGNEYTLRWAAPELLMDDEPCLPSNIWALGWIFYEAMANSIPFEDVRKDSMVIKHVIDGKLPIVTDHIRMSLILKLCSLMVGCWNVDPTRRPTAEACIKSLNWMPMATPIPQRGSEPGVSRARSPELLMKLGEMYRGQNDSLNASKLYAEALNLYTETSNNTGMASALHGLGQVYWTQSEYSKAATSYSKALEISTNIGDKRGRSFALRGLAKVHCDQKEFSQATTLYSEVIQISIELDEQVQRADALRGLAEVHQFQKDYDQPITYYSEAVEIYTKMGSMSGRTTAVAALATVLRLQSKQSEAFALFSESLKISTDIGDKFGRAFALTGLGDIHRDQDRNRDALPLYDESADIFQGIGYTHNAGIASRKAADVRRKLEVEAITTE